VALSGCVEEDQQIPVTPPPQQVQRTAPLPPPVIEAPTATVVPSQPPPPPPSVDLGGKTDIALLLPLTGPNAALGRDMLNAADLALLELGGPSLALTPKDTHGTPEGAADAARAATGDGAKLIIGPLTTPEVAAVKPIAQAAGIPVVAFSNQIKVAGDGVFLLGFLPKEAARRIASYAHSNGVDRFAVLAPSTPYGQLATDLFQDAVRDAGGTIDQVQFYDPGSPDPRPTVQALSNGGKPNFQGLLIPDSNGQRLKNMASLLPVYNIGQPDVRLLGTDAWDVPDLGSEPAMIGGWYAAPPPDARAGFESRFKQSFGHSPQRLATLAYDAVGIAAVLQKTPGADFSTTALTNPSGFAGPNGIFRLLPDGTTERGLAVLQVERSGISVVSPAPDSFQAVSQ